MNLYKYKFIIICMNELKIDQTYYPIAQLKVKKNYLSYEIEDLYYSYNQFDDNLTINYILNIPFKYLCNHIKIKSYYLNSEIKLFYSIYDDYLSKYISNGDIKNLKRTSVSYLGNDAKYFPKYIIQCLNDKNVSNDFKCILLALINCKKIDIKKRLELYDKVYNININLGNIFLKVTKDNNNRLTKDTVTFSSLYQII